MWEFYVAPIVVWAVVALIALAVLAWPMILCIQLLFIIEKYGARIRDIYQSMLAHLPTKNRSAAEEAEL